ncbi:DUF5694 domain-containing protein [uncultured Croceitalea sp.]|uniref:DUF5694 domain-containing protein n=1 Tax=uncultured Croceitalea sp. TaxID=1798908 RepID=UPI00374F5F37
MRYFYNMRIAVSLFILITVFSCQHNNKKVKNEVEQNKGESTMNVLLLGTFHFANFNPENNGDLLSVSVPDVLLDKHQKELEHITEAISKFNPDKIFLEYRYEKQSRLDSIYDDFTPEDYSKKSRNEIIQLGFRVAKNLKHKQVYAIDVRTDFPYDSLVTEMQKAKQFDLLEKDSLELLAIEAFENEMFASNQTLSEMLFYQNDDMRRKEDLNWYLSVANQGGAKDNFVGAYLASEWYRRNLYMYSLIQKNVELEDKRIMVLAGASHIGVFKDFIDKNPEWQSVELEAIMEN